MITRLIESLILDVGFVLLSLLFSSSVMPCMPSETQPETVTYIVLPLLSRDARKTKADFDKLQILCFCVLVNMAFRGLEYVFNHKG